MKQRIKHFSKSTMSVILAVCMLVSCLTVGLIATDAAQVTEGAAVSAKSHGEEAVGASVSEEDTVGADSTFANGSTIYFQCKDGWDSNDAVVGAIFYSSSTTCYNTGATYNYSNKPNISSYTETVSLGNHNYMVTVPAADLKYVQFLRIKKSDNTTVWNYSKQMKASDRSDNSNRNKVTSTDWTDSGSWSLVTNYKLVNGTSNYSSNTKLGDFVLTACASSGGDTYTISCTLNAGSTYSLYVYDKTNTKDWRVSNGSLTRSNNSTTIYNYGSGDNNTDHVVTIIPDVTGNYIFTFKDSSGATGNFSVEYPPAGKSITISSGITGGTVNSDKAYAQENDTVTLSNTPNPGYVFGSYSVIGDTSGVPVTVTDNTFVMPDEPVTVSATFNAVHSYYITSAGATDSDKGFTNSTAWAETQLTGPSGTAYTQVYDNVPMGWYRFKVKNYYGSSVDHIYGGAYTTYTDNSDTNTRIPTANRSAENNGNAKFYLSAKSKLTVTFDSDTGGITVTASTPTDSADEYEYYVVGMYSDGTEGMFGNVWADDWKTYSSADKMTETSTGVWTKTYTSFGGSYGTYSYKIVKVNKTTGTYEAYDNAGGSGANLTVDIPDGTTSAVFKFDSTKATESQVSCAVSAESGWQPGDPGSYGSNAAKYVIWGRYANYSDSNKGSITAKYNTTNTSVYYADLTAVAKAQSEFYLYLSNNNKVPSNTTQYKDALGTNTGNTFNGKSSGETVYYNTNQKVYKVSAQQNTDISGEKEYAHIKIEDNSKIVAFGVKMTFDTSGNLDYSFYYNVKGSGGGTDPTYVDNVDIYAKSACLRDGTYNRFADLAKTEVVSITTPDGIVRTSANWLTGKEWSPYTGNNKYGSKYGYEKVTGVPIGSKVKLRTTLSPAGETFTGSTRFKDSHYLKAYSFNGYTYELHSKNDTGVYEEEWTAEAINTKYMKDGQTVEITPIYYLKDNTYTKTFFIDGYEGLLQEKWGTLLCVYPYYKGSSNKSNAFGGYPGQPMLYWGGKFQMEIPLTVDGTATGKEVKGLTMHNAYWDLLHRKLDGKCDDGHCQTYDYDDFYKIYREKNADTIFFRFKYYPKKDYSYNGATISAGHDNYGDGYSYDNHSFQNESLNTAAKCVSAGNGVEIVTDYYGKQIDVFGTRLTSAQQSGYDGSTTLQTKELLLVSTGYKNTYVGHYATEWAVYAPASGYTKNNDAAHKFIGYISSSMLYLNNIGRVSQYSGGTNTGDGQMSSSKYKNTYNYLKEHYEGVPALISYEKEIHNYSLDQADRSDGKWYYSTSSDRLTANIKIQTTSATTDVTLLGDHNWTDSAFTAAGAGNETNVDANGNSAYFTNTTPEYLYGKTTSGSILADPSGQFTFQAYSGNGWTFVGWVRYSDGKYYEIADKDGLGSSNISANDTYIARFMPAAKGSLVISHNIVKDSTHKGDGTKYLKVEVMNGDSVVKTYEKTDGSDIDVSGYIDSTKYSSYKLRITLVTEPDEDCAVADRSVALGADSKYDRYRTDTSNNSITPASALDAGVTYNSVILVNISDVCDDTNGVTALRYTTKLTKTELNYAYRIVYTYKSRFWGNQTYTVEGFVDEMESAKYFSGVKSTATLNKSFIVSSTPYEKNFRQKIDWNYDSMTNNAAGSPQASVTINGTAKENVYFMQAAVGSTNTVDDTVRAEFFLPYKYNEETKSETGLDLYNAEGTKLEGTEIAFDDRHYESSTVKSQTGHLFNYDSSIPDIPTSGQTTDDFPKLVKAAPYVLKKGVWNTEDSKWIFTNLSGDDFHYADTYTTKEYDGNMSFEIDGTYYYATETAPEDIPSGASTQKLTASNTESWFDDNGTSATYTYAKKDGDNVYYFYFEENECLGYKVSSKGKVIDGIIQNSNAEMTTAPSDNSYTFYKKFYFTRWDIFTADGKTFVASSFANSRAFNYSGYEDYIIIPVYNDKESNSGRSTTITFMGDTRNQWNMGGLGHYKSGAVASQGEESTNLSDCDTQGDKILIDFGLAFNNAGTKLTPDDKAGFIIERLDKLDTTEGIPVTGLKDSNAITGLSYYEKKYAAGSGNAYAYDSGAVLSSANGFAADSSNKTKPTCSGAAIFRAATIAKLDNFDRMQYTNTFTNLKDSGQTEQALYVYRATSYLKVNNQDTVISEPIYFTIYDIASR